LRTALVALSFLVLALSHESAARSVDVISSLPGRWQRIDVDRDDASRLRGISSATSRLSWLMRSMSRPSLRRLIVSPEEYHFSRSAEGLAMAPHGSEPRPLSLDGTEREFERDSRTITLSSHHLGDAIEQRWRTQQGFGTITFRLVDDGRTLLVDNIIQVTAISGIAPIHYQAHFERHTDLSPVSTAAHLSP
jgi:hypothetical protein